MRHSAVHGLCGVLAFSFFASLTTPSMAVVISPMVQERIDISKSPETDMGERRSAARSLTDDWKQSLPGLIQQVDAYYRPDLTPPYREDDVPSLVALTDVFRTIIVNKDGAIQAFREADTDKTIRLLSWAARGPFANLRFNATYILASVVDNSNVCIVLQHLRDPTISPEGQDNLVQIVLAVADYAYKENAQAIEDTVRLLTNRNAPAGKSGIRLVQLDQSARQSANADVPIPPGTPDSMCKNFDYNAQLTSASAR
jgi:hypothetical protein